MGTCTGCYGSCDHTAGHSSGLLSAPEPLPLSCQVGKHQRVRGVWTETTFNQIKLKIGKAEVATRGNTEEYTQEKREKMGREGTRAKQRKVRKEALIIDSNQR